MRKFKRLLMLLAILAPAATQATPILNVDEASGRLLGALDVNLNGTLYNVAFVGGSCESVYSGCTQGSDFTFQTVDAAMAASQALVDQVFINGPSGNFDTTPALIGNCIFGDFCSALTPYSVAFIGTFTSNIRYAYANNNTTFSLDVVSSGVRSATYINRWQPSSRETWASWSLSSNNQSTTAVPEAPTGALFCLGLMGMTLVARRR